MFTIINKQILAKDIKRLDVLAEPIANRIKPGQFVFVIPEPGGEWLPFSVADFDRRKGTITLILQEVGLSTQKLGSIPIKENIFSILGPYGKPASIEKYGLVICVSTGIGTAQIYPLCRALKEAGNKVIGVMGAKSRRNLVLESQMRITCHKLAIMTEDGSYEKKGSAAQAVKKFLDTEPVKLVYAIGAEEMMKEISQVTMEKSIRMLVQLNPLMLCASGVCGSCRVRVNGLEVLACQEGPEFDGHQVDFDDLRVRARMLREPVKIDATAPAYLESDRGGSWRDMLAGFWKKLE